MGGRMTDGPVRRAMKAHTDLNIFDAILCLTETHLRGDQYSEAAGRKIRAICKQQCSRLLSAMDTAEAEATRRAVAKESRDD